MIFGVQEFCFAILFEILFVPDVKTDSYIAISYVVQCCFLFCFENQMLLKRKFN